MLYNGNYSCLSTSEARCFHLLHFADELEESDDEYPSWNCLDSVDISIPKDREEKSLCYHLTSSKFPKSAYFEKRQHCDTLVLSDTILKPDHNKPVVHENQHERHAAQEVFFS